MAHSGDDPVRNPQRLLARIRETTGVNCARCYQCGKCSAGCPMAVESKLRPHDVLRMLQRREDDALLASESLWLCLTCEACSARCPNACDPASVIDALREIGNERGLSLGPRRIAAFHDSFLRQIRRTGRIYELGLVASYKLRSGALLDDVRSLPAMLDRGKLRLTPIRIRGLRDLRGAFDRCLERSLGRRSTDMGRVAEDEPTCSKAQNGTNGEPSALAESPSSDDTLGFFPGCSLHSTSREYAESLRALAGPLGMRLREIDDWACCGASSAHMTNKLLGVALPARTLALAAEQGHRRVLAPCAACFNRLAAARHQLRHDGTLAEEVEKTLERPVDLDVSVVSIVGLLSKLTKKIRAARVRPLDGLKVACYYGCLLARPPEISDLDDPEGPTSMETVVEATGAKAVQWNRRLDCCGGGFSLSRTASVVRLSRSILEDAQAAGADVVVVACPMCHSNLDFRQGAIARRGGLGGSLPVLYLSQLVGLSLGGDPREMGLHRHFVDTSALVERLPAAEPRPAHDTGVS